MYGGFFVTLLGRHFGHVDTTVRRALAFLSPLSVPPATHARNCSIKVGGSSCAQNLWFSDSSVLCKVRVQRRCVRAAFVIIVQLRPGEGSSKMIEVDALYSPHLQQQPQVCFHCPKIAL